MNVNTIGHQRLVKLQVATKAHECAECVEPIEEGERYMRVALPPSTEVFPDETVFQEDAWQFVDRTWTIEKTHELCYARRYFRAGGPQGGLANCGHKRYGETAHCAEIACSNYVAKSKEWHGRE